MRTSLSIIVLGLLGTVTASSDTLRGFASRPGSWFVPGPTSGQFINPANGVTPPFANQQPLQGDSAILIKPGGGYQFMSDNGFGAKANSADALLGFYDISIDWKTSSGGTGTVTLDKVTRLNDSNNVIGAGFNPVYSQTNYPNGGGVVPVDPAIVSGALLTGADFDTESFRRLPDGSYWFGDEFGPFLVHTDANGKLLSAPVALPGVQSPDNPFLGGNTPNLARSRGFEGMALNGSGTKLYPMLEGSVSGDPAGVLRIHEFDPTAGVFGAMQWTYELDNPAHAIGDFTAVNDSSFLVIERDNFEGAAAAFKKIFLVNLNNKDADGNLIKTELVDLLNIDDPDNLGGAGNGKFKFPFQTIEGVAVVDRNTLLVTNDNNFPFSNGRVPGQADPNEFLLIELDSPLPAPVPEPSSMLLIAAGLATVAVLRRRF